MNFETLSPNRWKPTATPAMQAKILPILTDISDDFCQGEVEAPEVRPHLLHGALFLGYLSQHPDFRSVIERSESMFQIAVERADEAPGPYLYGGYVELGWYAAHLGGLLGWDVEDLCSSIDQLVLDALHSDHQEGDFDLIHGLTGIGVYGIERRSRPILTAVLRLLEALARPMGSGSAWFSPPRDSWPEWALDAPEGVFDCGMAHGAAGVTALLASMVAQTIEPERALELLRRAAIWVESCRQDDAVGTLLPHWIIQGRQHQPQPGRIAWCYGDLGSSVGLLRASDVAESPTIRSFALDEARMAAARPLHDSGVKDASICHGSIGNAHAFGRLHQATAAPVFLESARHYLEMAITQHRPGTGFGGFTSHTSESPLPEIDASFLGGTAGIGLGLLAAIQCEDPGWDRLLLLSPIHAQ